MIILDTSAQIGIFRGDSWAKDFLEGDVATTVVSHYEIPSGIRFRKARAEEIFQAIFLRSGGLWSRPSSL